MKETSGRKSIDSPIRHLQLFILRDKLLYRVCKDCFVAPFALSVVLKKEMDLTRRAFDVRSSQALLVGTTPICCITGSSPLLPLWMVNQPLEGRQRLTSNADRALC